MPHLRGMGKYLLEVASRLESCGDFDVVYFTDRPEERFIAPKGSAGSVVRFDCPGYRFSTWEQVALPLACLKHRIQVLHCAATTLPAWQPVNTVATVHDTLPWTESQLDGYQNFYWNRIVPAGLAKARSIITISECSRLDISTRWPSLNSKVIVVPHGVSSSYVEQGQSRVDWLKRFNGKYLLYVGGSLERKRFHWALRAFNAAADAGARLVACGFRAEEVEALRNSDIGGELNDRIVFLPFVSEDEMPSLYQQSNGVLYPTLYEGFGLPALEAQAAGSVVVFSSVSSLRELIGPLAEVVPADDFESWVRVCRALLGQYLPDSQRVQRGVDWARAFSWNRSAERHREVLIASVSK